MSREVTPARSAAIAESPPPTTTKAPLSQTSATEWARSMVPTPNGGVSKTPIGPFHKIVWALSITFLKVVAVSGPISNTMSSCLIAVDATTRWGAPSRSSLATMQSTGKSNLSPLFWRRSRATGTRSSSTSDAPMDNPMAWKKVFAMAPPISNRSTR